VQQALYGTAMEAGVSAHVWSIDEIVAMPEVKLDGTY
jgi:hypothetical protein